MINKKWIRKTNNGRLLFYNKIIMGGWDWDGLIPPTNLQGEKLQYKIHTMLPSIKLKRTHFLTQAEAEQAIKDSTKAWIKFAGLEEA